MTTITIKTNAEELGKIATLLAKHGIAFSIGGKQKAAPEKAAAPRKYKKRRKSRKILEPAQVDDVVRKLATGHRNGAALAREYGISNTFINRIKEGNHAHQLAGRSITLQHLPKSLSNGASA